MDHWSQSQSWSPAWWSSSNGAWSSSTDGQWYEPQRGQGSWSTPAADPHTNHGSHQQEGAWQQQQGTGKRNGLTRKTTDEGKNYQRYTYLGSDTKTSLPSLDRAKLLVHLFDDHITMVRAQQWESDTMDAIIFMATKAQPLTKLHCLSIEPTTFRDLMAREYNIRKERDPEGTGNLIN
jgi:hypothetical protein